MQERGEKKGTGLRVVWAELESGMSLTEIARRHRVSRSTLADRLRRDDREEYMRLIRTQNRNVKKNIDLQTVWTELESGMSLTRTAKKHEISRPALTGKLRQNNEERYKRTMESVNSRSPVVKRSRALSRVSAELLKEFEDGASLGELSRRYAIYKRTLQRRLMNIYREQYKELLKTRRVGFGSRTGLGDSELETEIMKLLDENGIRFNFHTTLSVEGHRYIPDFIVGDNTIIEVTGMTTRRYWEHTSEKLKRYIKRGYRVILVIQRRKLRSVKHYFPRLSKWFVVIEYEKLKASFRKYSGTITPTTRERALRVRGDL